MKLIIKIEPNGVSYLSAITHEYATDIKNFIFWCYRYMYPLQDARENKELNQLIQTSPDCDDVLTLVSPVLRDDL